MNISFFKNIYVVTNMEKSVFLDFSFQVNALYFL